MGFITPVASGIAKPLVGSLIHDAVKKNNDAQHLLGDPQGGPANYEAAIQEAVSTVEPRRWGRTLRRVGVGVAACAVAGSLLSDPTSTWYRGLRKPAWQPPNAVFPVVWTSLYTLIAVASTSTIADLHDDGSPQEAHRFGTALTGNLLLNAAWSGLFFRARHLPLATVGAAALAASSIDLARRSAPTGRGKVLALGAYAAWCTFATALSADLTWRNRGQRRS